MLNAIPRSTGAADSRLNAALFATVLSTLCWGAGTVMSKATLNDLPPITLVVVQLAASCAVLWAVVFMRGTPALTWKQIRSGWAGILEPGLSYLLGIVGLSLTSASNVSIISATEPAIVVLLAGVLLGERNSRRTWMLVAVVLIGTLLISGAEGSHSAANLWGDLLTLASTAFAACYGVVSRKCVAETPPLVLTALHQTSGLICALLVLPLAMLGGEATSLAQVPTSIWLFAMFTGVVQCALAFLLYLNGLKTLSATHVGFLMTLIPVFGLAGAALFLGEPVTLAQGIGISAILCVVVHLRSMSN